MVVPVLVLSLGASACGDDGDRRASQARDVAADAGLAPAVQDFFELAARGASGRFQVTYPNERGDGRLVLTQDPPNRRVDLVTESHLVESRLVRGEVSYLCRPDDDGRLACERTGGNASIGGAFDDQLVAETIDKLRARADEYEFRVDSRKLVGTDASCLVTTPRPSAATGTSVPPKGTMCLSPEGALLVVQSGARSLSATGYTTDIPDGIFDLPVRD